MKSQVAKPEFGLRMGKNVILDRESRPSASVISCIITKAASAEMGAVGAEIPPC